MVAWTIGNGTSCLYYGYIINVKSTDFYKLDMGWVRRSQTDIGRKILDLNNWDTGIS